MQLTRTSTPSYSYRSRQGLLTRIKHFFTTQRDQPVAVAASVNDDAPTELEKPLNAADYAHLH